MTTPRIRFQRPSAEIFFDYKKELANSSTAQKVHAQVADLVALMDQGKIPYPVNGVNSTNTEKLLTAMATGFYRFFARSQPGKVIPPSEVKKISTESFLLMLGLGSRKLVNNADAIRLASLDWNKVDWISTDWDWFSNVGIKWSNNDWAELRKGLLSLGVVPTEPKYAVDISMFPDKYDVNPLYPASPGLAGGGADNLITSFDQGTPPKQKYLSSGGLQSGIMIADDGPPYVPTIIYGRRWSDIPWGIRWDQIPFDLIAWFTAGNIKFEGLGSTHTLFGKDYSVQGLPKTPRDVLANAWAILRAKCSVGVYRPAEGGCSLKAPAGTIYTGIPQNPFTSDLNTPPDTSSNSDNSGSSGGIKIPGGGTIVGGNIGKIFDGKQLGDFGKPPVDTGSIPPSDGSGDATGGGAADPVQVTQPILVVGDSSELMGKGTGGGTLLNDIENSLASKALGELGTLCLGLADAYNEYNNVPAIQIFYLWQAKGNFVVLRKGLGQQFCSEMAKYGKSSTNNQAVFAWTAYEFPPANIGSIAGDPNSYVWSLPYGDKDWGPYVQYVPASGGGTSNTTPPDPPVIGCQEKGTVYWPGMGCIAQDKAAQLLRDQTKCLMTPGSTFDPSTLICTTPSGPVCPDGQPADPQTGCSRTEEQPPPSEEKSSSTGVIIGVAALIALVAGVGVVLSGDSQDDQDRPNY